MVGIFCPQAMNFLVTRRVPGQVVMPVMTSSQIKPDPAAIFAAAFSLWEACSLRAKLYPDINLSHAYDGYDQLMREVMRIAELFERWACDHIDFDQNEEVWPYLLGDRFGQTCLKIFDVAELASFAEKDCFRIAVKLSLPIRGDTGLPLPVDVICRHPNPTSEFKSFRIQTIRKSAHGDVISTFSAHDDPCDPSFEAPFFAIYGIRSHDVLEHIADRWTYSEATHLLSNLIPGIEIPAFPFGFNRQTDFCQISGIEFSGVIAGAVSGDPPGRR
jgi:hypothetical protein